jgi:hypothetical protein
MVRIIKMSALYFGIVELPDFIHRVVVEYQLFICFPSSITNKMQRYTIFFIAVNVLHVSGGFYAHHQECG